MTAPGQKLVVTGGVGFIGSHLCHALLARGDTLRIVDDFSNAPYPTAMKEANLTRLRSLPGADARLSLLRGDIADRELAERACEGMDGIVHLAGLAGVRPSFAEPARYVRVNVEGTANLLDVAQNAGHRVFVLASSSSVYGNSTPLPASEDEPSIEPESPYAASKRGAELALSALAKKKPEIRCASLRFFTVYGPRQRPEMAITLWLRKILAGEPITMFGDGSMRRDFTHVEDIVRGVIAAVDKAPAGSRVWNLGSGAPVTLTDLVSAMGRASGKTPEVLRAPVPLGDVEATFADITRARDELGWSPAIRLEDGLRSVVDWMREET